MLLRNALPWGWAALLRPDELKPFLIPADDDEEEADGDNGERISFVAVAHTEDVWARARDLAARGGGEPRWAAFGELAKRLEGVGGFAVLDPMEVDLMGEAGVLEGRFRAAMATLDQGGQDYGEWAAYLDGDLARARIRARRATRCPTSAEAFAAVCIGGPEGAWAGSWAEAWPPSGEAPLKSEAAEGELLLAGLEARGLVEAPRRALATRMLSSAARFRSVSAFQELLGLSFANGWLIARAPLDEGVLGELIAALGD